MFFQKGEVSVQVRRFLPWVSAVLAVSALAAMMALSATAAPSANERITLVTDVGRLNDRSFNHLAFLGLTRAESKLKIRKQVYESTSPSDYGPNLTQGARTGSKLTIAVGF